MLEKHPWCSFFLFCYHPVFQYSSLLPILCERRERDNNFCNLWLTYVRIKSFCSNVLCIICWSISICRTSINSQKLSDERHSPFLTHDTWQHEMRLQPNFRPRAAVSGLAGQEAGDAASFRALRYYQNNFLTRRDEILTDIAKNG